MKAPGPRTRLALRVGLGLAILGALIAWVPTGELLDALGRLPPWVWGITVAVYLTVHLMGVAKWRLLMARARAVVSFDRAVGCYYQGLFANLFLPSVVGGDLVRVSLALKSTRKVGGVLVGSATDRLVDMMSLVVLAAVGAGLTSGTTGTVGAAALRAVALLLLAVAVAIPMVLLTVRPGLVPRAARRTFIEMRRSVRAFARRPSTIPLAFALALATQGALVVINTLLSRELHEGISFATWLFLWPMAKIVALVPLTQGGIGVREAGLVAMARGLGLPTVPVLAVGLVFQAVVVVSSLIAGVLGATLLRRSSRKGAETATA